MIILGGRLVGCTGIVFGDLDAAQEWLVSKLDDIEIGDLPLSAKLTIDLVITDPYVALNQAVELTNQEVLGQALLKRFRGRPKIRANDPFVGLGTDKLAALITERWIFQYDFLELILAHSKVDSSRLGELELAIDEHVRRLAREIHLAPELVPFVTVNLRKTLIETPHLVKKFGLRNTPIADLNGGTASSAATGAAGPPIDKHQEHENQYHTPENELEVTQIVSQPLESHCSPPPARKRDSEVYRRGEARASRQSSKGDLHHRPAQPM
jgi:hypothetical protein